MGPNCSLRRTSALAALEKRLQKLRRKDVLVGIPASSHRDDDLAQTVTTLKPGSKKQKRVVKSLIQSVEGGVSNAELLYIHTHGSPLRGIPARPVIEPAIEAPENKANIAAELQAAAQDVIEGNARGANQHLKRAGQIGANASRRWFTDPRNGWERNAPSTIREKGSDRPLIDTGELRRSITYVVRDK